MELQVRFPDVVVSHLGGFGGRERRHAREAGRADVEWEGAPCVRDGLRHTISETWLTTSEEGPAGQTWGDGHEVSDPLVMVISWRAERSGPRIIAAPHRGQAHVAVVVVSVATDAGDATDG